MQLVQKVILLLGMSMVLLTPILPYVQYALFQERIATFLCENQSRPELNCKGQCFLSKQIKAQFEEDLGSQTADLPNAPVLPEEVEILPLLASQAAAFCTVSQASPRFWAFRASVYASPSIDILVPPPKSRRISNVEAQ